MDGNKNNNYIDTDSIKEQLKQDLRKEREQDNNLNNLNKEINELRTQNKALEINNEISNLDTSLKNRELWKKRAMETKDPLSYIKAVKETLVENKTTKRDTYRSNIPQAQQPQQANTIQQELKRMTIAEQQKFNRFLKKATRSDILGWDIDAILNLGNIKELD